MEQFNVPDDKKVSINYSDTDLPASVKIFKPVVFKDGDLFCVILGPDAERGVCGYGDTPKQALMNWDKDLQERLLDYDVDAVVKFIVHYLKWYRLNSVYSSISLN